MVNLRACESILSSTPMINHPEVSMVDFNFGKTAHSKHRCLCSIHTFWKETIDVHLCEWLFHFFLTLNVFGEYEMATFITIKKKRYFLDNVNSWDLHFSDHLVQSYSNQFKFDVWTMLRHWCWWQDTTYLHTES